MLYQLSYGIIPFSKVLSLFLGVQKYGKNHCWQIFLVIFFNGKMMVINISSKAPTHLQRSNDHTGQINAKPQQKEPIT